ncbi:MAG: biopolymer transporter ExbD [Lentisphaeria bacterium]|nr:biopolymer transporter ExbD [Lentisphaeria bacterium]
MRYTLPPQVSGMSAGSLSSMIDIVFLLIIFFVVTASFDREQIDSEVSLPVAGSAAVKSFPPVRLMINILRDGTVKTGFYRIPADRVAAELTGLLRDGKEKEHTVVIINADRDMPHKHLSAVMEALAGAGYAQVRINAEIREGRK